jgi:hypothetical protein
MNVTRKKGEQDITDLPQNYSPHKYTLQDEKYGEQVYQNNSVTKQSFQRSSIKSINNQDSKLPKVEYRKTINSLKGFSETNVIPPITL